ncbi:MAG: hypothetical protein JRJ03_09565 [Deltaproteobacteria bacterium]|nr:hypothetical protein [Deltaproteobacteria bacterium]
MEEHPLTPMEKLNRAAAPRDTPPENMAVMFSVAKETGSWTMQEKS